MKNKSSKINEYMVRIIFTIISILVIIQFISCGNKEGPFPIILKDDFERTVTVPKRPLRIVSLAPSNTQILYAIGAKDRIVGVTEYCDLPDVKAKKKVGGFSTVDVARVVKLKPDLVLAFGSIQKRIVKELDEKNVLVFWLYPRNVHEVLGSYLRIGKLIGEQKASLKLFNEVKNGISSISKKLWPRIKSKRPTIFRIMGLNPLASIGNKNFQNDIYYTAGGENIFSDIAKDFFMVDKTVLRKRNPDIIVACGKNKMKVINRIKGDSSLRNLSAVVKNNILVLKCNDICRPNHKIDKIIEKIVSFIYSGK